MINALIVVATAVLIPSAVLQNPQSAGGPGIGLHELTVPQERLPVGCALSQSEPVRLGGGRVRVGSWAGLPIDTNPWIGTDRQVIATVRERMDGPVLAPDGPPLTRRQLSQYRLHLADGVEEAYAAVYRQAAPRRELIVVYASRFSTNRRPVESSFRREPESPRVLRLPIGPLTVVVHGDGGDCFQAIGTYLKSLGSERK